MIEIPLYIFLFIYFALLIVCFIFSLVNFYHIINTASFTMSSFIISFFIFSLTILTLYSTWYLLSGTNWQNIVTLFNSDWLNNILYF